MSLGELWCLSFSWLQGHTAQNARFAAYIPFFSVKRRFRSSVDAAMMPCPVAPAQVSIIIVFKAGMSMGELWCLSFSWLQGHTAQNARFAAYFPVKRHFRSSVDAAVPCPIAPAQVGIIVVYKSRNELGELWCLSFSWLGKDHTAENARFAAYFPVKRRFRSSVDAACALPRSTSQSKYHCCL